MLEKGHEKTTLGALFPPVGQEKWLFRGIASKNAFVLIFNSLAYCICFFCEAETKKRVFFFSL